MKCLWNKFLRIWSKLEKTNRRREAFLQINPAFDKKIFNLVPGGFCRFDCKHSYISTCTDEVWSRANEVQTNKQVSVYCCILFVPHKKSSGITLNEYKAHAKLLQQDNIRNFVKFESFDIYVKIFPDDIYKRGIFPGDMDLLTMEILFFKK